MPSVITRGAITIKAFGFARTSKSGGFLGVLKNSTNNNNQDTLFGITATSAGNVYLAGRYNSAVLTSGALAKYNSSATLQWQRQLYDASQGYATILAGVALDSSENVYSAGYGERSGVGGVVVPAFNLWKHNSSGTLLSHYSIDFYENATTQVIYVDGSGNIYVVYGTGGSGARLLKLNSSFVLQWGVNLTASPHSLAVDSSGNVFFCVFQNSPSSNLSVVKYNSSGVLQWQRTISNGADTVTAGSIAVDSTGSCFACGLSVTSGIYFGFIVKYNSSGVLQWQRKITDSGNVYSISGVACDANDNVYGFGVTNSKLAYVKYNSSGVIQWQRTLTASTGTLSGYCLSVSSSLLYFGGNYSASYPLFFGAVPIDGSGAGSYVLDGVTYTYATSSYTAATATLTDAAGALTSSSITPTLNTGSNTNAVATMTSTTVLL